MQSARCGSLESVLRRPHGALFGATYERPRPVLTFPPFGLVGLALLFTVLLSVGTIACGSSVPGTIGAGLGQKPDHRLFVRSLPPGEGAERAGLLLDDEILLLDGKDVRAMSQEDVRRAVRGDVGSALTVTILRGGETRQVKVVRTALVAEKAK